MKIKLIKTIIIITITILSLYCSENQAKLNLSLIRACKNGNINIVKKTISKGADVNVNRNSPRNTPLIEAAGNGFLEIVK